MGSPSELSLECKPQIYSMLLKSFGDQQAPSEDPGQKLEDFLGRLEEERLKIEAFKRELPLCMQLLTNAVEASKQQLQVYRVSRLGPRPVLEEFIPIKNSISEGTEKNSKSSISDKTSWMNSAQLWSQASDETKQQPTVINSSLPKETDIGFTVSPKLALDNKQWNGGAFLPFCKDRNSSTTFRALPELALASSNEKEMEDKIKYDETENAKPCSLRDHSNSNNKGSSNFINGMLIDQTKAMGSSPDGQGTADTAANNTTGTTNAQTHRKARRCWSPDLHQRFVNALQMLGGSHAATPKQIRELMKVEGLTNDEVKSHLQKYRLHNRRPGPIPQATGGPTHQLVVLGGIWVPPEYATAVAHGGAPALYGSHPASHGAPHYCAPAVHAPEFYATAGTAPHPPHNHEIHHHHLHQQQLQVYTATPQTHSSPESGMRGSVDRSESIEDGKSESSSWKGDGGDGNAGERKGLSSLRDDREESNGRKVTLKF